jgi:hypothetical protein
MLPETNYYRVMKLTMPLLLDLVGRKSFIETMGLNLVSQHSNAVIVLPVHENEPMRELHEPRLSTVSFNLSIAQQLVL